MEKWYLFDENGEFMHEISEFENFDKCSFVYVSKDNYLEFKNYYAQMGFKAQDDIVYDKLNERDADNYEFTVSNNIEMIKKVADFLERENTTKPKKAETVISNLNNFNGTKVNLILHFKDGNSLQTNEEPTELSEILEAIPLLMKPSMLGRKIQSFKIEIVE